jgi:phosphoribosylformylglycinamidine cyclo-ligase
LSSSAPSYAAAGVDIVAAEENVRRIAGHVKSTQGPQVLGDFGAFAGLYHLKGLKDPVLVTSTDGTGTKLELAIQLGQFDTIGRDLVNLSVNDVLTTGARPIMFLDYIGVHSLEHDVMEQLVGGMAKACRENGCALMGGETAQLPEVYKAHDFDMAGFVVGVVERDQIIDGSKVQAGDEIWALPSTGLHTNGYSLARKIVADAKLDLGQDLGGLGKSFGDALLAPHPSYLSAIQPLLDGGVVRSLAHITGGGLEGNLPRVLPESVSADVTWGSWAVPGVFGVLQEAGGLELAEMLRVFNMGLGMIVVTPSGTTVPGAAKIGSIVPRAEKRVILRGLPA